MVEAHIIHDARRTDRWALLQAELQSQNDLDLRPVYWPAVHADKPATGISRAHKQIIQHAKDRAKPYVLVLEDDVHFTSNGALKHFLQNGPQEFDLWLGGVYWADPKGASVLSRFSSTHCYVCHHRFYDTFLAADETLDIDQAIWGKGLYKVCRPFVAIQHPGYSDNAGKAVDYNHLLQGEELYQNLQVR